MLEKAGRQSSKRVWWLMSPLLFVFFPYLWASGTWLVHRRANWAGRRFPLPFAWTQSPVGADFSFVATHPPYVLWGSETRLLISRYDTSNIDPAIVLHNVEASAKERGDALATGYFLDSQKQAMFCFTGPLHRKLADLSCISRDAQWMIDYTGDRSDRGQAQQIVTSYIGARP